MRGQPAEACDAVADLAARMRSDDPGGVVGLDLAGDELHFNNSEYVACFRRAKERGLRTTVHAGECFGNLCDATAGSAPDVRSAVEEMGVDRIGHGYAGVLDPGALAVLKARRVHLEACPGSAKTEGHLELIGALRDAGLNFGLNEDDPGPGFGKCTMAAIEDLVTRRLGFTASDVAAAHARALAAAFGPVEPLVV